MMLFSHLYIFILVAGTSNCHMRPYFKFQKYHVSHVSHNSGMKKITNCWLAVGNKESKGKIKHLNKTFLFTWDLVKKKKKKTKKQQLSQHFKNILFAQTCREMRHVCFSPFLPMPTTNFRHSSFGLWNSQAITEEAQNRESLIGIKKKYAVIAGQQDKEDIRARAVRTDNV